MMKTKLTIAMGVMTAALFVLIPNAESKKVSPSGVILVPHCSVSSGLDTCTLDPVPGLPKSLSYVLEVVVTDYKTSCSYIVGGVIYQVPVTAAELGTGFSLVVPDGEDSCASTSWTFNLYSHGSTTPIVPTWVGSGTATDPD